jgi:ribosome-associated protein
MTETDLRPEFTIRLDQFLKYRGITVTGGQAKHRIQAGEVKVNGVVETRRGHNLRAGDVVEVDGKSWTVEAPSRPSS